MSTVDQAQIRERPPAKDWHPNHWAAPPTIKGGSVRTARAVVQHHNAAIRVTIPKYREHKNEKLPKECERHCNAFTIHLNTLMSNVSPVQLQHHNSNTTSAIFIVYTQFYRRIISLC